MNDLQKKLVDERFDKLFLDMPLYSFGNFRKIKNLVHSELKRAEKAGHKAGLVLDECLMKKFMKDERIEGARELAEKLKQDIHEGTSKHQIDIRIIQALAEMGKKKEEKMK